MNGYLWIGSFLNDDMAQKMRQIGYSNPASILSQKNILQGLENVTGKRFDSIGALTFAGFPKQKFLVFKRRVFSHAEGAQDTLVGFLNVKYLNKAWMGASLARQVRKKCMELRDEALEVYVYEMRSACLRAAREVKRLCPKARVHLIVPDLPQFMDLRMNKVKRLLKEIDWRGIRKNLRFVDDYILYAAPMAQFLHLKDGTWMVMEGLYDADMADNSQRVTTTAQGKTVAMYSGSIKKGFGIQNLLDAMTLLDDSFELWLTGGGDYAETVKAFAEKDKRVKFFGFLPTPNDVRDLQEQSTVLINMRDPDAPASKYCFPSKIFEYMALGKPVLSCRMDGIPNEYYDHLIPLDAITPEEIAKRLRQIAAMREQDRIAIGEKERAFILREKTKDAQAKRIAAFTAKKK